MWHGRIKMGRWKPSAILPTGQVQDRLARRDRPEGGIAPARGRGPAWLAIRPAEIGGHRSVGVAVA